MRVLLVSNHHGDLPGGAVAMMAMTQELLEQGGHQVIPFALREDANPPSPWRRYFPSVADLRRQPLPSDETGASPYSFPARGRIARLIADARPDVAHLHNVFSKLTLSVVDALDEAGVPVVLTLHEYKSVCPNGLLFTHDGICHRCLASRNYWNAIRHRCLDGSVYKSAIAAAEAYVNRFRATINKVTAFIAPSEFLRDVVVAGGLPAERVHVLPNPSRSLDAPRAAVGLEPVFVYSGRLIAGKGVDVLLDAAALVTRDIRIRIFGTGPLEEEVRREAAARSLPVELRGYSTKAEIAAELDRSLALVLASVWYENCPMVILEAAGRGVAAIGSDLGGIRELIDHKESGLLVPPGDPRALASALEELADQPDWALQLGRSAWERVRDRHDPAAHIDRVVAIYERVVSGNLTRDALGRAG